MIISKPKLMGLMVQFGVKCLIVDDAQDLSLSKGVLRFPSHDKRKTCTPNTDERWAMEQTIWEVVGGERK